MTVLMIAIGAAIGAPARYFADRAVQSRHDTVFPWGTLSVNLLASLLLGVLAGAAVARSVADLIGTGFCGALSTYSTFSFETVHLAQRGARFHAMANAAVSIVGGIGAAALGWSIGLAVH